ncbi:MAG: YbjN domain-containing protein [Oscillospiraceae bacterium]|nr:YbjN domain-containing protein [Oscillospiraceae bacterium]
MVFPATEAIRSAMQAHDLHCGVEERDTTSTVHVGINAENASFEVLFISNSEDNDTAVRVYDLIRFPEDKCDAIMEKVNEFNCRFRYLKFVVDTAHNTVDAEYDLPISETDPGEPAYEILMRCAHIIDACYPKLMQVLSGEEKEES